MTTNTGPTTTPATSLAERARAAHQAAEAAEQAQREQQQRERCEYLTRHLLDFLGHLGVTADDLTQPPALHQPYQDGYPDYAYVIVDGLVFATGFIGGIKDARLATRPCASGDGRPSQHQRYIFTGVIHDYLRQLGKWLETVEPDTDAGFCTECLDA